MERLRAGRLRGPRAFCAGGSQLPAQGVSRLCAAVAYRGSTRSARSRDEHVLVELAAASARPPIDVPPEALLEPQSGAGEDVGVEVAPVVDDDQDRTAAAQPP